MKLRVAVLYAFAVGKDREGEENYEGDAKIHWLALHNDRK